MTKGYALRVEHEMDEVSDVPGYPGEIKMFISLEIAEDFVNDNNSGDGTGPWVLCDSSGKLMEQQS